MIILFLMLTMLNLDIRLQPKQVELYNLTVSNEYSILGYGGSAGGAKSHGLRDISLILSGEYPGIKIGIFRRVNKQLTSNHIIPFFQKYPQLRTFFNKSEKIIYYPNGSITRFVSADLEDSILDIQGDEFDISMIDEATHFTQGMIEYIGTRTRTTGISNFRSKQIMSMNPGNIGHAYIKRIFIDKIYTNNEDEKDYKFIPARIYDNVLWCDKALAEQGFTIKQYYEDWTDQQRKEFCYHNSEYAKRLMKLPEELRLAYLEGDWDIFGGQFFKDFNKQKQIIEPFEIPNEWKLIGCIDPGFSSPCSFSLLAQDFEGNIYTVATYYEEQKSPDQHARDINIFIKSNKFTKGRKPSLIVSGLDAFAHKDRYSILANDKTFADMFMKEQLILLPAVTDRKNGWWAWKSLMPDRFYIFKHSNNDLIREMESVISDSKHVEDIQGKGNDPNVSDHALDSVRYGIMSIFKPIEQEKEHKPGERERAIIFNQNNYDTTSF